MDRWSLWASWWVMAWCGVVLAGCLATPSEVAPAAARLVVTWDPLGCGEPHRVVVELEDEAGEARAASVPCNLGGVAVDVGHFGLYRGRIYAWAIAAPIRSVSSLEVAIEEPIVTLQMETPR
ncbi:MAG: hypothetical protein H7138_17790 [Myxococcales bacterium]|nr:hypothetical protein [Myxococcales bacterium]